MIIVRTPYRFSFAGGGTDFPEWFESRESMVVTSTIDYYSYITLRKLENFFEHNYRVVYSITENAIDVDDIKHPVVRELIKLLGIKHGLEIHHDGELPAKSGLGSSSSFTVGLVQAMYALMKKNLDKKKLANLAIKIEREILKENVGLQDQVACTFGGFNVIKFKSKLDFNLTKIEIDKSKVKYMENCIKLVYTGKQRFSSNISEILKKNFESKSHRIDELQERNLDLAKSTKKIFQDRNTDLNSISEIFNKSWEIKRELNPKAITADLEHVRAIGLLAGASGAKVLGAGGGGFIAFWVEPDRNKNFIQNMDKYVITHLKFENEGSKIIFHSSEYQGIK